MAGKTKDPKPHRITLRLSDKDMRMLRREATRTRKPLGAILRNLIRLHFGAAKS